MDAFHVDSCAVVTCFRAIWSLVLSPRRLDWPLPFSGRHGRKRLVAFVAASKFPISESERQWPYMVITPVPSSWLHTSHLRRQSRREGEERRKLAQSLFLWGTESVKILAGDSKSPPFLWQSLLVLHCKLLIF